MQVANKSRDARSSVILAVLCLVLQLALAPNVALGNGRANFALIYLACVSLWGGVGHAVSVGFVSGLLFDLTSTTPVGLMAFCLTLAGLGLSLLQRDRPLSDLASSIANFSAVSLAVSLAYHLAMLLTGGTDSLLDALVFRALPTALLTIVFFLPFAYYFTRIRTHGSSLGGSRPSGRLTVRGR